MTDAEGKRTRRRLLIVERISVRGISLFGVMRTEKNNRDPAKVTFGWYQTSKQTIE